jgi:hypothetical protein
VNENEPENRSGLSAGIYDRIHNGTKEHQHARSKNCAGQSTFDIRSRVVVPPLAHIERTVEHNVVLQNAVYRLSQVEQAWTRYLIFIIFPPIILTPSVLVVSLSLDGLTVSGMQNDDYYQATKPL